MVVMGRSDGVERAAITPAFAVAVGFGTGLGVVHESRISEWFHGLHWRVA